MNEKQATGINLDTWMRNNQLTGIYLDTWMRNKQQEWEEIVKLTRSPDMWDSPPHRCVVFVGCHDNHSHKSFHIEEILEFQCPPCKKKCYFPKCHWK
jgi:hypothetical protein